MSMPNLVTGFGCTSVRICIAIYIYTHSILYVSICRGEHRHNKGQHFKEWVSAMVAQYTTNFGKALYLNSLTLCGMPNNCILYPCRELRIVYNPIYLSRQRLKKSPDLHIMCVQLSQITFFRSLSLDFLVACRTAPNHSQKNPIKHMMSALNNGLQCIGVMRK